VEIVVRGKHFSVPDEIEERARRKLAKLDHYLPALSDASVEVDLSHEKAKEPAQRYLAHVRVSGHGVHLETREHASKPEAAIDLAARVLTAQARKQKELLYGRARSRATRRAAPRVAGVATKEEPSAVMGRIGRTKRFDVKPMTPQEAIAELEAIGHEFFLFYHAGLDQYAVLYRRRAGDYGLIVPELS
jgi:putative sigma-54 modulation protein